MEWVGIGDFKEKSMIVWRALIHVWRDFIHDKIR